MLQDFLSSRSQVSLGRAAAPAASASLEDFQPLFTALREQTPRLETGVRPAAHVANAAARPLLDSPEIELVQENGKVVRIIVTCTCCQRIELECDY